MIVDEAARANPLDLMVPLSLAKERIVLVGDHRQLPQLLDDSLVPGLSSRHDPEIVSTVLSRSMFERLFLKLREAERQDGTKRVITLDRQFRTHPVLGTFISEQFYAPFGENLSNGNPDASAFAHNLPAYGRAACGWIDVPVARGAERKAGTSISRPVEADVIVRELSSGLQAFEGPHLRDHHVLLGPGHRHLGGDGRRGPCRQARHERVRPEPVDSLAAHRPGAAAGPRRICGRLPGPRVRRRLLCPPSGPAGRRTAARTGSASWSCPTGSAWR